MPPGPRDLRDLPGRDLLEREKVHKIETEGAGLGRVPVTEEAFNHQRRGGEVAAVNEETRITMLNPRRLAQPSHHGHAAILAIRIDVVFAAEVVIEVDFVPAVRQPGDAGLGRPDPDRLRASIEEDLHSSCVVVHE